MAGPLRKLGIENQFAAAGSFRPSLVVDVSTLATGGSGTVGSPWTGWEAAANAIPANSRIYFPGGQYAQVARIDVKDRCVVIGDGKDISVITSAHVGTGFRMGLAISPAIGHQSIRGVTITNTNVANVGSGILAVGSFFSDISDVKIVGSRYGISYINTEVFDTLRVDLESQTRGCLWIVNNGDYNPTYADIDYSAFGGSATNALLFLSCQMNPGGGGLLGVIDDGGYCHTFVNCNFNAGTTAMRFGGSVGAAIMIGCDYEGQTQDNVIGSNNSYNSNSPQGGNREIQFIQSSFSPAYGTGKMAIDATSIESLILIGNRMNTPNPAIRNPGGCNLFSIRNVVNNGPLFASNPASFFDVGSAPGSGGQIRTSLPIGFVNGGRMGQAVLAAGTIAVAAPTVTANTRLFKSVKAIGGTPGTLSHTLNPGVGFTINSSLPGDTSTVEWLLFESI
jgi:hypothetical protein